jgi:peptide/nickel transport system permease protein
MRGQRLVLPGVLVGGMLLVALAGPLLPLADPVRQDVAGRLMPFSAAHWLGKDEFGRDVLSRLILGARVSLSIAVASTALGAVAGICLGIIGGYFRGAAELVTMRMAEIVLCFPPLLLALLVVTLVGPGAATLILCLAIVFTPAFARVAYAATLSVRSLDYVTAQVALGKPALLILWRTILPNIAPPLIVQVSLTVAAALLLESGLSFLGLGVVPPAPSWGLMIRGARGTMEQDPLLLLWPCLALTGAVLALNLLCDRLREVLDPRGGGRGRPGFLRLFPALPTLSPKAAADQGLLAMRGLTLEIAGPQGPIAVVRDVSLTLAAGETLALVGESGSGKTLTALAAIGLLPSTVRVVAGEILYTDRKAVTRDLLRRPETELRRLRGRDLAMIFQDPSSCLNPLLRVGVHLEETLRAHHARGSLSARVVELLRQVGLPNPERCAQRYPHELSGGQRQRVMIAAAVANHPNLLLADEPTTALDVTVQAQILQLLAGLKRDEGGFGMVFVTHNLAVVARIADRVAVMYAGELVEEGPVAEMFARPLHPYTAALIASTPEGDAERLTAIPGTVPQPSAMPPGCRFVPRCAMALPACDDAPPPLAVPAPGRATRCLRWEDMA